MAPGTRASAKKGLKLLLTKAKLSQDAMDYVLAGIEDPEDLVMLYNQDAIDAAFNDEAKLPPIRRAMLKESAAFIEAYYMKMGSYDALDAISDEDWLQHINRRGAVTTAGPTQPTADPSTSPTSMVKRERTTIKLSDFPTFNGRMSQWGVFNREFKSVARLNKLGELLNDNPNHETQLLTDATYKSKVEDLYDILNKLCACGDASSMIEQHEVTQDGYRAWKELSTFYFAKGNIEAYVTNNISDMMKLHLEYNTPGGMEHYIACFEEAVNNLEEINQPMSEILKKTFFLQGIKNPTTDLSRLYVMQKGMISISVSRSSVG